MLASIALALSLLISAASTTDVVVITLPARGDVNFPLTPTGKVEARRDGTVTRIKIELERISPPPAMGAAFTTYVAWTLSPEGSLENVGELFLDKDKGRLETTTRFEQLGVLITAEPHYMVDRPSAAVAFRSQAPRNDFRTVNVPVEVGAYDYSALKNPPISAGSSLLAAEARAAVQVARLFEAERWAEAEFRRARVALDTMEEMVNRSNPPEIVAQSANETIRRAQQAFVASREKKVAMALESARNEVGMLTRETQNLNARIQQLTQQQNALNGQISRLQSEVSTATRDSQRLAQEKDQVVAREKAVAQELSELKSRQEQLQPKLVLQMREEFFDLAVGTLTPAGREALALFEAARAYLVQLGIPAERIVLRR
jgi:hypothetical protein